MTDTAKIVSKMLVQEVDKEHMLELKKFFTENNLIGLKAEHYSNIKETLESNIDLGAILLCEEPDQDGVKGIDIALQIHSIRPELPIFFRREGKEDLSDFSSREQSAIAGVYQKGDLSTLKELLEKYIFNNFYPSAMIHGIEEISEKSLNSIFKDVDITVSAPYLIRDRIIYGELFSLIPLESNWCRGFMMLQTEEDNFFELIKAGKTPLSNEDLDFRKVNGLMGEVTNMIWGGFKSRFFKDTGTHDEYRIQVPTIINHIRNYISFGSEDPQLCFHYKIHDKNEEHDPVSLYQKFIFHLNWSPEEFQEPPEAVEDLVEAGELEFFKMRRIILGITGATGIIYGIRFLEFFKELDSIETHLIVSKPAQQTLAYETDFKMSDLKSLATVCYSNENIGASIASGSFQTAGMIIAPCSIHTLSSIAHCLSNTLISRAADVTLKERRPLIMMVRETPLHNRHLENMLHVTNMGGIITPPVPAFYHRPKTIDDIVNHTVGRILDLLKIEHQLVERWKDNQ